MPWKGSHMLDRIIDFIRSLFSRRPVRLAIVRRYQDANYNYVGELYMEDGHGLFGMIGASLDSFSMAEGLVHVGIEPHVLDTENDFLAPMPSNRLRVGSLSPDDNDKVRKMIGRLPRKHMTLAVRNGFIEQPTERKTC